MDWEEEGWGVREEVGGEKEKEELKGSEEKGELEMVNEMKEAEREYRERKTRFMGVKEVVDYLKEIRSQDLVVIDTRKKSDEMDYLVCASGLSHRHVEGIAKTFYTHVKNESQHTPFIEGEGTDWVIVDIGHMLISFSRPEVRKYHDVEARWLGFRKARDQKEEEQHETYLSSPHQPAL
eukprot:CAMPEP_0201509266 /NCGR_PEP_ID=MMETSP0161_2-20130828/2379_1 /ASSEMBLY_ACC=CAM_ASM_000251 /TAXON_ID=180227 /ORGANISM="Neoparamoeba aestuarina, Strain SoJaBio B1-5/56/2" /LENGTH=178 /DNA_ID=CAMNT_0047904173 /DNA_START=206 /DNA_END=742 /DNA_ORIENTATION=-